MSAGIVGHGPVRCNGRYRRVGQPRPASSGPAPELAKGWSILALTPEEQDAVVVRIVGGEAS